MYRQGVGAGCVLAENVYVACKGRVCEGIGGGCWREQSVYGRERLPSVKRRGCRSWQGDTQGITKVTKGQVRGKVPPRVLYGNTNTQI